MSLFSDAKLILTPNGYKDGKIYALKPFDGSGDFDVVRATSATRVNSAGLIESVGNNIARLDYTEDSCPCILIEPQRTNLFINSDTPATQNITTTATTYTLSFYDVGEIVLSGSATGTLTGINIGERVSLTFTATSGTLTLNVTNCEKVQLEVGNEATSYIPTTTTTVTRNADVINRTGVSNLIGQTSGEIFMDCKPINITNDTLGLFAISDGTATNRIVCFTTNNNLRIISTANGVTSNFQSSFEFTSRVKIRLTYASGVYQLFANDTLLGGHSGLTNFSSPLSSVFICGSQSGGQNRFARVYNFYIK